MSKPWPWYLYSTDRDCHLQDYCEHRDIYPNLNIQRHKEWVVYNRWMPLSLYGCRSITSECPSAEHLKAPSLFSGIKHHIWAHRYTWNLADSITSLQRTHERGYSPSPNVFTGMWEENLISCYAPRQQVTLVISELGSREQQSVFTVRVLQW